VIDEERGDKATQRAVLSFLLAEWPAQHTGFSLMWMGFGDFEELREALRFLHMAELVFVSETKRWSLPKPHGTLTGWNSRDAFNRRYALTMPKRSGKPRDANALARRIVDEATGEVPKDQEESQPEPPPDPGKDPAAVALGRRGGRKGGKARAEKMTPEQRSEAARRAAKARWKSR
jgi:hypothetical protein